MAVYKIIYKFCQFCFEFPLFNLFNSVCKKWTIDLRRFNLLERAQRRISVLFPQESFFQDVGQCVQSFVLLIEMNCSLDIIQELSTFYINMAPELILEKCLETVSVLVAETDSVQFLLQLFSVGN